jgi:HD-like signal output (HDOD) protein
MLIQPLPNLAAWVKYLRDAPIAVLPTTVEELTLLRGIEEEKGTVDAQTLTKSIAGDPLMTLRVLIEAERRRRPGAAGQAETVTAAIVLMGINPFFKAFTNVQDVLQWLDGQPPQALMGLQSVLRRSYRAANFALAFAVHRMDGDADVLQEAALIHDFCEMLLWLHAPALALRISQAQRDDPHLRSAQIQRDVLNVELQDLAQALMHTWHLPDLLVRVSDDKHADHPQVRTVMLAIRVARHTQDGWNTPGAHAALPSDIAEISALLNLSEVATHHKLLEVDR